MIALIVLPRHHSSFDCTSTFWVSVLTSLRPSMTRTTVSTPPWCLICSLNSALPAAKFQAFPPSAFCESTTLLCERRISFKSVSMLVQGTHLLPVVRVAGHRVSQRRHDDFHEPPGPSTFQLLQSCVMFLECFHFSAGQTCCFSIFMLWLLCSVNPLDCRHSWIILTLAPASACTVPAAIPTASKIHTDGPLNVLFVKCSRHPGVHCRKHSWEWSRYVRFV